MDFSIELLPQSLVLGCCSNAVALSRDPPFSPSLQDDALLSKVGIRVMTSLSANSEISSWFVPNNAASFSATKRALAARGEESLKLSFARTDSTAFCRIFTRTRKHRDKEAQGHQCMSTYVPCMMHLPSGLWTVGSF